MNIINRMVLFSLLINATYVMSMTIEKERKDVKDQTSPVAVASTQEKESNTIASTGGFSDENQWHIPHVYGRKWGSVGLIVTLGGIFLASASYATKLAINYWHQPVKGWPEKLNAFMKELSNQEAQGDKNALWMSYSQKAATNPYQLLEDDDFSGKLSPAQLNQWLEIIEDWTEEHFHYELSLIISDENQEHLLKIAQTDPKKLLSDSYVQQLDEQQKIAIQTLYSQIQNYRNQVTTFRENQQGRA